MSDNIVIYAAEVAFRSNDNMLKGKLIIAIDMAVKRIREFFPDADISKVEFVSPIR